MLVCKWKRLGFTFCTVNVQNAKSTLNIWRIRTLTARILLRILRTETVKNDVFSNEWVCDNLTGELEWWQVQGNTPGKGE